MSLLQCFRWQSGLVAKFCHRRPLNAEDRGGKPVSAFNGDYMNESAEDVKRGKIMRRLLLIGILLLCLGLWVNADNNLCHTIWQGLCHTDRHWQAGYLASLGVSVAPHEIPPGAQSCITIRVRSNLRTSPVISRRTLIDTVPAGTVLHILATAHDDDGRQWYRAHWNGRQVFWAKWLPHSNSQCAANALDPNQVHLPGELVEVNRVIDGDTIEVRMSNGNIESVRYIGVDTPERGEPCWDEARNYNASLLGQGAVRMAADTGNRDRYGRLLRYVYAGNTFINLELVKSGYAAAKYYSPNGAHRHEFEEADRNSPVPACGSSGQSVSPPQQSVTRSQNNFSCGRRKTCGQMSSCAEARFHFTQCGNGRLDGDNDGIPCEAICG